MATGWSRETRNANALLEPRANSVPTVNWTKAKSARRMPQDVAVMMMACLSPQVPRVNKPGARVGVTEACVLNTSVVSV